MKFYIGEEYKLASDITDISSDINITYYTNNNLYQEYKNKSRNTFYNFFRKEGDTTIDDADLLWKEDFLTRPYILTENKWTPDLNLIISPLFKGNMSILCYVN